MVRYSEVGRYLAAERSKLERVGLCTATAFPFTKDDEVRPKGPPMGVPKLQCQLASFKFSPPQAVFSLLAANASPNCHVGIRLACSAIFAISATMAKTLLQFGSSNHLGKSAACHLSVYDSSFV